MKRFGIRTTWLLASTVLLCAVLAGSAQDALPEGEGKQTVRRMCGEDCHGLRTVTHERSSRDGWTNTVDEMVGRGAIGSEAEINIVVEYLTKNFGKVNVNKASTKELETYLGFSSGDAETIVGYRRQNGDFKTLEDLKKVPGVDVTKVESKRDLLVY